MLHILSPVDVQRLLADQQIVLIDVREPAEFGAERIHGALLCPLSTFDPACLPSQEGKKIVLHCGVGKRSAMAAEKCLAAGWAEVTHLEGGLAAWKECGHVTLQG